MGAANRMLWFLASVAFAAALIALWQRACDAGLVSPVFVPAPGKVWQALAAGFSRGAMLSDLGATLLRVLAGWVLASLIGIALGAAIGISQAARIYIAPTLEVLRPLPVSALVPIFIGFLGFSEPMVLAIIAFGALWPSLLNTVHGFVSVSPRLYDVSRVLGLSRPATIVKIALPSALPDIIAGIRLGLTLSLILVVVGEILGSRQGLGYSILLAQRGFRTADLFAGIAVLSLVGYLGTTVLDVVERRAIYWR